MKKYLAILSACLMLLSSTACGAADTPAPPETTAETTAAPIETTAALGADIIETNGELKPPKA